MNMNSNVSKFDQMLEYASSPMLRQPDQSANLELRGLILQKDVPPQHVLTGLTKKLFSENQHTASYALLVFESMAENWGYPLLDKKMIEDLCHTLNVIIRDTPHENVRQKLLELIQTRKLAFCKSADHNAVKLLMSLKPASFKSPIASESAPEWQDGDACCHCHIAFSILQRKYHCRACGGVFCARCSQKTTTLPKFGIEKEVRVCDACYDEVTKPYRSIAKEKSKKFYKQKEIAQEKDIDECLLESIKQNNLHDIDDCLARGADINKILSDCQTPVTHAVITRNTKLVEHLLNKGADVCKKGNGGKTPLSVAAEDANFEMVKILLERGADATIQTAFLDAIQSKNLDIVKYMKEKGALINWTYKNGSTPLTKSLQVGDDDVAKYLIENGATINEEQQTILLIKSVEKKNLEFIKILVDSGADLNKIAPCSCTPLTKATTLEDFEMVKYIVGLGADVNCRGSDGKTALAIAASKNCLQIVKFLMESGASINLAKTEVDDYAEWNEDFDIFLKLHKGKLSLKEFGAGHEEAEPDVN